MFSNHQFSKKMMKALILLVCIVIVVGYLARSGAIKTDLSIVVVGCLVDIIFSFLILCLIQRFRISLNNIKGQRSTNELSVWGYVWRTYLVVILSKGIAVFFIVLSGIKMEFPSVQALIATAIIQPVFILLIVWLFYSNSRIEQLQSFLKRN